MIRRWEGIPSRRLRRRYLLHKEMTFDIVSVAGIVGFATAAMYFLSKARRADDLRARLPKWIRGRGTEDEFFPFRRWTWTVLPDHWVSALLTSVVGGIVFAALAVWFFMQSSGMVLMPALLAVFLLVHSVRIAGKVSTLKG